MKKGKTNSAIKFNSNKLEVQQPIDNAAYLQIMSPMIVLPRRKTEKITDVINLLCIVYGSTFGLFHSKYKAAYSNSVGKKEIFLYLNTKEIRMIAFRFVSPIFL